MKQRKESVVESDSSSIDFRRVETFITSHNRILLALGVIGIAANTVLFLQFTVDDGFIAFRYAKNLVNYGIWNWNPDHDYVEAYTSFTYAVLAIVPEFVRMNTALFFKLIGMVLLCLFLYRIKKHSVSPLNFMAGYLFLSFNFLFFIHLYSGLETPLFMFLIFELVLMLSSERKCNEKYLYLVLLLLPLTRPEGVIFSAAGFITYVFLEKSKIRAWIIFFSIVAIALLYFIWRLSYFGHFFPNTFYVKSVSSHGVSRMIVNTFGCLPYLMLVIATAVLYRKRTYSVCVTAAILVFVLAYSPSELLMDYADRFFFQLFFPVFLAGLITLPDRSRVLFVSLLFMFVMSGESKDINEIRRLVSYYPRALESHKKVGQLLQKYRSKQYSLLLGDVGLIPYYAQWKCYDYYGLADEEIAHNGISAEYLSTITPDVILLHSMNPYEDGLKVEKRGIGTISEYMKESGGYTFITAFKWEKDYYTAAFVRTDLEDFDALKDDMIRQAEQSMHYKLDRKAFFLQKYLFR